jgi:hypothetical protein
MNLLDMSIPRLGSTVSAHSHAQARLLMALVLFVSFVGSSLSIAANQQGDWRWSEVSRLVVMPDIHGAYQEFTELLKATGVVDDSLAWSAGDTHLVSLGDLLDRGPDSRQVMDLLMRLQREAPNSGGRVHVLHGNHELMNLIADLRYVSMEEYAAFEDEESPETRQSAYAAFSAEQGNRSLGPEVLNAAFEKRFPAGYFGHRAAFSPGGHYGAWLHSLPLMVVINDIAFVHGGLPEIVASMELDELNNRFTTELGRYVQLWNELIAAGVLPAYGPAQKVGDLESIKTDDKTLAKLEEFNRLDDAPLLGIDGPTWYRGSVLCREILEDSVFSAALKRVRADRVVVGHTVPKDFRVHALHDGRLVMLDTGMLKRYYHGRSAALIIEKDRLVVQYLDPLEISIPIVNNRIEAYGMTRSQLLQAIKSGAVVEVKKGGPGKSKQVKLLYKGKSIDAIFYSAGRSKNDRKELATYHLDQLMGLELVPPTISREIDGKSGALQLWYPDTLTETQRRKQKISMGGWCPMTPQFELVTVWDLLLLNTRRSEDALLYRQRSWQIRLTNHSKAFSTQRSLPNRLRVGDLRLRPGVLSALKDLDESGLTEALSSFLDKKQIGALLSRRDQLLKQFGRD